MYFQYTMTRKKRKKNKNQKLTVKQLTAHKRKIPSNFLLPTIQMNKTEAYAIIKFIPRIQIKSAKHAHQPQLP